MFRMANFGKVCNRALHQYPVFFQRGAPKIQDGIPKKVAPEKNAKNNLPAEIWTSSEMEWKNKSVVSSLGGCFDTLDEMERAQWWARSIVKKCYGVGLVVVPVYWSVPVFCGIFSPIEGIKCGFFFCTGFMAPLIFGWFPSHPLVILFDNRTGVLSLLVPPLGLKKKSKMFIHIPLNCGDIRGAGPDEAADLLTEHKLFGRAKFIKSVYPKDGILVINAPVDLDCPLGPLKKTVIKLPQDQIDQIGEFLNRGSPGQRLKETEVGKELQNLLRN